MVPGLIVLCAGFGAGTTAVAVATDMSSGIVDRFRSMPIAAWSVLAGQIMASLARNLLATALVIAVGLGVGWRPVASPLDWLGAIAMIVLFISAMSWLAACFGLVVGSPEAANGATFALMFIPYLSSAFVPARTMAAGLRPIAANQPFTPVIETMRGLWMGHTSTGAAVGHEALLAVGLLRRHPGGRRVTRQLALPAPHGGPLTAASHWKPARLLVTRSRGNA